jgi:outer membrane protein assembly factor BamB
VTRGNYVLSHNIADYAIGLADLSTSRFIIASKAPAMDVWDSWLLNENGDGTVLLHNLTDKSVADFKIPLPLSPLGPSLIAYSSPDGKFLALSARTRGGVWNLATGERVLLSRRFTSAVFAADDTLYLQFPKDGKRDHAITHLSLNPASSSPVPYKEDDSLSLSAGLLQEWKPGAKKAGELIVHNVADNSILWRRTFNGGEPARTNNLLSGQTILSFPFKTDFAKDRLKSTPALADRASAIKNKDTGRLVQVLDNANGNVLHELVLEVPLTYEGVRGINVVGDNLYLSSDDNRTMVYALSTGAQLRQLFGYVIALDPSSSRICMVNRRDEAVVYDPEGRQIASFHTGSPLRFAAFQNNGTHLILLTADQKVRTMDISAPVAH